MKQTYFHSCVIMVKGFQDLNIFEIFEKNIFHKILNGIFQIKVITHLFIF